ncbi:hypothetical protein J2X63_001415 [Agromyces sp. 3263]|uniref:hypothetical protein n=1 Tax=Agromyces sp. 3263 TaxID=2817750 RepID=UPI002860B5E1|nr:hypothetical protein [Agromyces sp. 3263]MDR6905729.1 hypothetical protein [Agromyces sp. 3263]
MQLSADYIALGAHQADVRRAEQEIQLRMAAAERGSDGAGASSEPVARRRAHRALHAPRLALR